MARGQDAPVTLSDRYRLEERIGTGGAGVVWRATDVALGRQVAVKLLHPQLEKDADTVARFRREATAAAALNHPHAAVIYDIGNDDGRIYLVMELIDGPMLSEIRGDGLDADVVAVLGYQVAGALGAAHARGMVHRDIKPENVLLTRDGVAKVVDFGIAKAVGGNQTRLTSAGMVIGTAAYLAPEQLQGRVVDARADVYALGLLLHECLLGEPVFTGGTPTEVAARRLAADAPRPSERGATLPAELDEVIHRATRSEREQRYPDAAAMADALEPLLPDRPEDTLAQVVRASGQVARTETERIEVTAASAATRGPAPTTRIAAPPAPRGGDTRSLPVTEETVTRVPEAIRPASPRRQDRVPEVVPPPPPGDDEESAPSRRGLLVGAGLVALFVLALVAASLISGGDDEPTPQASPTAEAPANPEVFPVVGASDFDPLGGGGEHGDEVPNAYDGDGSTTWSTERYNTPAFGGLKSGVGIFFDLGEVRDVGRVDLVVATPGIAVQLFASDQPPGGGDPSGWGTPAGELAGAPGQAIIDTTNDATGRYWLVWITSLGNGNRAEIAEVTFAP